jgi:hypothetical protein
MYTPYLNSDLHQCYSVPETGGVPGEVQNCDEVPSGAFCEEVTSQEPTGASVKPVLPLYSIIHRGSEPNQSFCKIDEADRLELSLSWKVFLGAQLAGIIITTLFSLYAHYLL